MSGVRGALDDAQNTADQLHAELRDLAYMAGDELSTQAVWDLAELRDLAENLVSKIDQQRHALRRG